MHPGNIPGGSVQAAEGQVTPPNGIKAYGARSWAAAENGVDVMVLIATVLVGSAYFGKTAMVLVR
jgi:hypothetical protein